MNVNQRLTKALSGLGLPVVPDLYTGKAAEYITFNHDLLPTQFADGRPRYWRALIQVHYVCPLGVNSTQRRQAILAALLDGSFGWPEVLNATDKHGQHYVYETEMIMEAEE